MKATGKVSSASDARTANNVMRHGYRLLTDEEKAAMQAVKDKALELYELIEALPPGPSREKSLALTKAQECSFWAVSHITR